IAGEDDLDAPDLVTPTPSSSLVKLPKLDWRAVDNSGQEIRAGRRPLRETNRTDCASPRPELSAALSASLRDELLRQVEGLGAADGLLMRSTCALPHHQHSAARSAMSVRCRYAADTIARSIVAVMKRPGGVRRASTRTSQLGGCG